MLHGEDEATVRCPALAGTDERVCPWPAALALTIDDHGGRFEQRLEVFNAGLVPLPGGEEHWPLSVQVDGCPIPVVGREGRPQIEVAPGPHLVVGRLAWDAIPESLDVPVETGIVSLLVKGRGIAFPERDSEGRLSLGRRVEGEASSDSIDLSVTRKLTDEVPLLLTTRIALAVSGRSREWVLASALPGGGEPMSVQSPLPLRFEADGRPRLQVRSGSWNVEIVSRRVKAECTVVRPVLNGAWAEGDEMWAFDARPALRVVSVEGVPPIDPAQTMLPEEWKALPAYAMAPGAILTLSEQRRGDAEPPPDRLSIARTLWLDFDGRGYSVRDLVTGEFTRAWRLEMGEGTALGRVAVGGQDQFITRLGPQGRELDPAVAQPSPRPRARGIAGVALLAPLVPPAAVEEPWAGARPAPLRARVGPCLVGDSGGTARRRLSAGGSAAGLEGEALGATCLRPSVRVHRRDGPLGHAGRAADPPHGFGGGQKRALSPWERRLLVSRYGAGRRSPSDVDGSRQGRGALASPGARRLLGRAGRPTSRQ